MATNFQRRILEYVIARGIHGADCWEIAQDVFPEKWKHRAGRGALVGHIDRAASKLPTLVRMPPKDRFDSPSFFQKGLWATAEIIEARRQGREEGEGDG